MGLATHHFNIFQGVTCGRHWVGLRVDVRHIAPIGYSVTGIAGRRVGIGEDKSEDVGAIDDGFEVIDLRLVGRIPRAVEARAALLHSCW